MATETPAAPATAGSAFSSEREQLVLAPVFGPTLQDGSLRLIALLLGISVVFGTLAYLIK